MLAATIGAALLAAGKDLNNLTRDDLAAFDEFHVGGREATRSLAQLAGLVAGMRVLDIGCGIGGPARTLAAVSPSMRATPVPTDRPISLFLGLARRLTAI